MTGYLTLSEAAEYVATKTGGQVTASGILRAGIHGALLIAAPFASTMRNLTAHCEDEVLGLLTIPPRNLLEIETDGQSKILEALSLDGKSAYSPQMVRSIDQLRVLVSELDRSMDMWVSLSTTANFVTPESDEVTDTTGMVAWQAAILENWKEVTKKRGNAITARQVMAWCKESGPRDVFGCEQRSSRESMQWVDSTDGNVHSVTLRRIGTVLSEWRASGKIPPRK